MADEVQLKLTYVWWSGEPQSFAQHAQRIAGYFGALRDWEALTRERVVVDPQAVRRRRRRSRDTPAGRPNG